MFVNIAIINIVMNFGQFMMNTLIPLFADYLGASSTLIGTITSLFTVTALAVKPFSGPMIDTFQKKWILLGAIFIIIIAFIIYSMADSLTAVITARLLHGVGMGFTAAACLALATEFLPQNKLAEGIGYFTLGQVLATAIGPALGLALLSGYGYNKTFVVCTFIMAFSAILLILIKVPQKHTDKKFKITWSGMFAIEAIIPAVLQVFIFMSFMTINSFLVLYAQNERGVEDIGLWFLVHAVCTLITRPVVGKLADKYGIHRIMPPTFCIFGLSLYIISISTNLYMFLISAVIASLGYGVFMPLNQALCIKCVAPDRRGVGGNMNFIGMDIGAFFGPISSGILIKHFGYSVMFQLMIFPIVIAGIVFILCYPRIKAICMK